MTSLTKLPEQLDALRLWDGSPLPPGLRRRVLRVYAHYTFLSEQIAAVEAERRAPAADLVGRQHRQSPAVAAAQRDWDQWGVVGGDGIFWLARLQESAGSGRLSGLHADAVSKWCECPRTRHYQVCKRHVRWMTTELAWSWLRFQPDSALSIRFRERFGSGGKRLRRIGIVAVARKLLIALWRFLETGVLPKGAVLKEGELLGRCRVTPRLGGGGGDPRKFRACTAGHRIGGVASAGPSNRWSKDAESIG